MISSTPADLTVTVTAQPQLWVNDYAVDVDAEDDTRWDGTTYFRHLSDDHRTHLLTRALTAAGDDFGDATTIDRDDAFLDDPAAPDWLRPWLAGGTDRTVLLHVSFDSGHTPRSAQR